MQLENNVTHMPPTPVISLRLFVEGIERTLWLKLESYSPYGSIKGRTALGLWRDVAERVDPDVGIIESTSGNLGLALAALTAAHRVPFTAVMDPRTSASVLRSVQALGARVVTVDQPDGAGGYLLNRLAYIEQRTDEDARLVWPNQYANPANPGVHARWTAPELHAQVPTDPLCVLIAVSTGGTLTGFRNFTADSGCGWELVGVDLVGSAALGGSTGPRVLSGIGASRRSRYLPHGFNPAVRVTSQEAVSTCLWLLRTTGIALGSSAGALVASALRLFREVPHRVDAACVCPDGADRYTDTIYSPEWRRHNGVTEIEVADGVRVISPVCSAPEIATVGAPAGKAEP
ncbi:pyridoxal-phosphate dependent enzyme [Streptomyces iconiensis]|uniref:Pyridoxal-phosphate dependent enzyme n=1 Tax=Streptomyces iconiensis TaxID=1384038 RepID=A0ABT6ZSI4_9ACTN|nr:pyridoxal-phosphate dependent enzyme [Streptomyces iconiensis]MDJ1131428.1 pyridoxal-phosphate dependent enzyme [Streptomyces iconiensis]